MRGITGWRARAGRAVALTATLSAIAAVGTIPPSAAALPVAPAPGVGATQAASAAAAADGLPDPTARRASGLGWSSGVTPVDISGHESERFGRKRGAAVDNVVVYPGRESWTTMLSPFWRQALPAYFDPARDDLVLALPLWPESNSLRSTGTDEQWQELGATIAATDPDAFIRLAWEMDLDPYWQLTPANQERWIPAYKRAVREIQVTCPRCQIVWNPNHGGTQAAVRPAFIRLKKIIDVYGIDSFDVYPAILSPASKREHLTEFGYLNEAYAFARSHGTKFAVPEWGVACNGPGCFWRGNAGGDNPAYITTYLRWFNAHRTFLAFESYFEEPQPRSRSALYTTPIGPLAGRAYRSEIARLR